MQKPAISLMALPKRRQTIFEVAQKFEQQGFSGIYIPSLGDNMALALSLAHVTETIKFATSISPIYHRTPRDYAQTVAYIHEVANGRFSFGFGVSHEAALAQWGMAGGKPLADIRTFVAGLREAPRVGELPPLLLATLRKKMIALAAEIGDGMVFANAARSHMPESLAVLPKDLNSDFSIANMIPTCISDDVEAAKAVNRRTLSSYLMLPNYRNYWKEAGYQDDMQRVEAKIAQGDYKNVATAVSDTWLADVTLFGTASQVAEGIEAWYDSGVKTPIIVPSSASGNQLVALQEVLDLFA